jgi:predicted protein tyrosine phosphatase
MQKVANLLHASELVQVDGTEDSYYLGTVRQISQLMGENPMSSGWCWKSDSDICVRKRSLVAVANVDELIKYFTRAVNPVIRGIRVINSATSRVVLEYEPREWDLITTNLIMGSIDALKSAKYDCVVNCTTNVRRPESIADGRFVQLEWHDSRDQIIVDRHLEHALDKIDEWIDAKLTVLVHCEAGISRSGACVLAYLMRFNTFDRAYEILVEKRPIAKPNLGFLAQLRDKFDCMVGRRVK